jgi:hypothetical protein
MKLQHQYDLEDKIVDAQLDSGTDTEKVANEAERARIKVESEAETAAIKAQSAKDKLVFQRLKNGIDLEKAQIDNQVQIDKGNIEVAKSAALANQAVKNARKKGKKEIENAD